MWDVLDGSFVHNDVGYVFSEWCKELWDVVRVVLVVGVEIDYVVGAELGGLVKACGENFG